MNSQPSSSQSNPFILTREYNRIFQLRSGNPEKQHYQVQISDYEDSFSDTEVPETALNNPTKVKLLKTEVNPQIEELNILPNPLELAKTTELNAVIQKSNLKNRKQKKSVKHTVDEYEDKGEVTSNDEQTAKRKSIKKVIQEEDHPAGTINQQETTSVSKILPFKNKTDPSEIPPQNLQDFSPKKLELPVQKNKHTEKEAPVNLQTQNQVSSRFKNSQKFLKTVYTINVKNDDDDQDSQFSSEKDSAGSPNPRKLQKPQVTVSVHDNRKRLNVHSRQKQKGLIGSIIVDFEGSESSNDDKDDAQLVNQELTDSETKPDWQTTLTKKRWVKKQKHMFCAVGCCSLFFFVSVILWITLFQILTNKNNFLASVILEPPTLGDYHQKYESFWSNFEKNYDSIDEKKNILGGKNGANTDEFKHALTNLELAKANVLGNMIDIKTYLDSKINSQGVNADQPPVSQKISLIIDDLDTIERISEYIRTHKHEHVQNYQSVMEKVTSLYQQAFSLVDIYGAFHMMTNRIWVTTNDIFHLFQQRAFQVSTEVTQHHFQKLDRKVPEVTMTLLSNSNFARITQFPEIIYPEHHGLFLLCQISAVVQNNDLSKLGFEFRFGLVVSKPEAQFDQKSEIRNFVDHKYVKFSKTQAVQLTPDQTIVFLYGKVTGGDVTFQNVSVNCFNMAGYQQFPEYEK